MPVTAHPVAAEPTVDPRDADVVHAFLALLNGGDPGCLAELVDPEFLDEDPIPGQPAGAAGVAHKLRLYRLALPDGESGIEELRAAAGGVEARWWTRATGLDGSNGKVTYRYRGHLRLRGGRISGCRILSISPG